MTLGGQYSLIDVFESFDDLHGVLQIMAGNGDLKSGDLERLEKGYAKRDLVTQLKGSLDAIVDDQDKQRHQELLNLMESNLKYLFDLWRERNPDRTVGGFYTDLWEETKKTGVAPVVIVLGGVNLQPEKGSVVDKVLFEKRAQIPSLETTPVRYIVRCIDYVK